MTPHRRAAGRRFASLATRLGVGYRLTAQVEGYGVTDIEAGDVEYVSTDWDGSEAEASYPNPSDDDVDLEFLADHYLFVPEHLDAEDPPPKSAFKGPLRMGPGGPVNTNALMANVQAINGARGGFKGVDTSTLEAGYDAAVDHLVEAGEYDSADDAPEFKGTAALSAADHDYSVGDLVRWMDGNNDVFGVVRDRATEGDEVFQDEIDGDFALSPTEDNPGFLVETMDETDDGWVPSGTMTGHRGETLESWNPDKDVMKNGSAADVTIRTAEASGSVGSSSGTTTVTATASGGGDATLTGIIWGAGDHDLALGGDPTPVHVPEDTIRPTFEALKEDIDAGDVTLGFDHPGEDSVASKTGIVDIGRAEAASLSSDGRYVVMTDSSLQNDQAAEAAAAGDFDDLDWSVVADVAVRRTPDGSIAKKDGRVVIDATRIRRVDAVETGAVDAASIERDADALPDLQQNTRTVQKAADDLKHTNDAVQALEASRTAITDMNQTQFDPHGVDDLPAAREQLDAAATVIDKQKEELESAQAKASGFKRLLQTHDVDLEEYDDADAAAQAVIDEQTEDLRREIAELEAELAQYDTGDDDVRARASELAGSDPDDLRGRLNEVKATAFDVQSKSRKKGRAAAKDDMTGRVSAAGGRDAGGNADADDVALAAMDGKDRIEAEARGQSPSEYVNAEYGLQASSYGNGGELHDEIMNQINGGGE